MANSFIRLEIDCLGISIKKVTKRYNTFVVTQEDSFLFENMSDQDNFSETLDAGLNKLLSGMELDQCSSAVVFISSLWVRFRTIALPFKAEKKIEQVLDFELEAVLPAIETSYLSDFHLTRLPGDMTRILCASVDKCLVGMIFSRLGKFKIKPILIAPKGVAAGLAFLREHNELSDFAFLHVTESEITLTLVYEKTPCAVRAISAQNMSCEQVAIFVKQTLLGFYQRTGLDVVFECFICVQEGLVEKGIVDISTLYTMVTKQMLSLSGLGAVRPGHDIMVPTHMSEENLLAKITPDHSIKLLFDFCKEEYSQQSFIKSHIKQIGMSSFLLLCVLVVLVLSINLDSRRIEKKIAMIDERATQIYINSFPGTKKIQDPYLQMKANVQQAVKNLGDKKQVGLNKHKNQFKAIAVIAELSQKISKSTRIQMSRLLLDNNRLVISGSTDNFYSVDQLKNMIESSKLFTKVDISSAVTDKRESKVNFKFNIGMVK